MPVAGWYPDPYDPAGLRYYDGTQWTSHAAPAGATQPVAPAQPQPVNLGKPAPVYVGPTTLGSGSGSGPDVAIGTGLLGGVLAGVAAFVVLYVLGEADALNGFEKSDLAVRGAIQGALLGVLVGLVGGRDKGRSAGLGAALGAVGGALGGYLWPTLIEQLDPDGPGIVLFLIVVAFGACVGAGAGWGAGGTGGFLGGLVGGAVGWGIVAALGGALTSDVDELGFVLGTIDFDFVDEWRVLLSLVVPMGVAGLGIGLATSSRR